MHMRPAASDDAQRNHFISGKRMRGGFSLTISRDPNRSHVQVKKSNAGAAFIRLTIPSGVAWSALERRVAIKR